MQVAGLLLWRRAYCLICATHAALSFLVGGVSHRCVCHSCQLKMHSVSLPAHPQVSLAQLRPKLE